MFRFVKVSLRFVGFLFAAVALLGGCASKTNKISKCVERRAIYDVGSGSTKLKLADVNFCKAKIEKVIYENAYPVDYAADAGHSKSKLLSLSIRKAGINALEKLQSEATSYQPKKSLAVMTGIFRKASNAEVYRAQLQKKFGFKFKVVSQDLEARYGFESVRAGMNLDPENLVIWDIGGSTMQFAAKKKGAWIMDLKDAASVQFKEDFILKIQRKNPKKVYSPNPVGVANIERGIALARKAAHSISAETKFALADPKAEIVGIGGVHRFSVAGQTGQKTSYDLKALQKTLPKQAVKTDQQIGGEYSATEVSNLMLVAGFTEELGIRKVRIGRADISDGVLLHSESW